MNLKEWAHLYAENGFAIFPLKPKDKTPLDINGSLQATTEESQIEKWWSKWPNANIGIVMGKNKLIGLDHDVKDGADPHFIDRIPATYTTCASRGGFHIILREPTQGIKNAKQVDIGVTVRSGNYYFVAPPSIHPSGIEYTCRNGIPIWKAEIADCPEWIISHPGIRSRKTEDEKLAIGHRHRALLDYGTALRRDGKKEEEIRDKLIFYNEKKLALAKPVDEIEAILEWVMKNVSPAGKGVANEVAKESGKLILNEKFKTLITPDCSLFYEIIDPMAKEISSTQNDDYLIKTLSKEIAVRESVPVPDPRIISSIIKEWKFDHESLLEFPRPFCWPEEDFWTLKKLTFNPSQGCFDSWKEFLLRLTSPEDFMAFIWSIFEPENKSRQFLYLVDPAGEGGKSTIISILGELLGNAFAALSNQNTSGDAVRWLPSLLLNKRLIGWADCKNPKFPMTELIRNITSGDPVVVEKKGEQPFTVFMRLKLIIGSNHAPEISHEGANTSRLIRIDITENGQKNDPTWPDRLRAELPAFLFECRYWYQKSCVNHGNIELTQRTKNLIGNSSEGVESKFEDIIERRVIFGDHEIDVKDWERLKREERLNDWDTAQLKRMILMEPGTSIRRDWERKSSKYGRTVYKGFKIREGQVITEHTF